MMERKARRLFVLLHLAFNYCYSVSQQNVFTPNEQVSQIIKLYNDKDKNR